jgi:hypothetical protein
VNALVTYAVPVPGIHDGESRSREGFVTNKGDACRNGGVWCQELISCTAKVDMKGVLIGVEGSNTRKGRLVFGIDSAALFQTEGCLTRRGEQQEIQNFGGVCAEQGFTKGLSLVERYRR